LCSAFVIFEKPTPRMPAKPSKSPVSSVHGIRSRERGVGWDRSQRALDCVATLEDRCDLARRDARAAAVGQPEVAFVERRRPRELVRLGPLPEELERHPERVADLDAVAENDHE
jgi:hypothetical protein